MRKAISAVILGAPGGGKGTICKKLKADFNFEHVIRASHFILRKITIITLTVDIYGRFIAEGNS